jgi:hypothetical protein
MSDPTRSPITEEMLVQFLINHSISSAEELNEFSLMVHLMQAEPDRIFANTWSEEVTLH